MAVMYKRPAGLGFASSPGIDPDVAFSAPYQALARQREAEAQRRFQSGMFGQEANLRRELAEKQFGYQSSLAGQEDANRIAVANIAAEASKYPHLLRQQRWNTLFPYMQRDLQEAQSGQAFAAYGGLKGDPGPRPYISDAPVYSDQMIQERVNAQRSASDAALQSRQAQTARQMAGRGYGARSPLAMALSEAAYGQNLAGNTAAEQQMRLEAAKANAEQVLKAQGLRSEAYTQDVQADVERKKTLASYLTQLRAPIYGSI